MNSSAMLSVAMLRPVENTLAGLQREWGSSVQPLNIRKTKMPPILYIYIFIESPWAYIFRVFLFTILVYGIKALVRTIPGRAHTFLSKKKFRDICEYMAKKKHHRFNSE
jgi:hypothetical protein